MLCDHQWFSQRRTQKQPIGRVQNVEWAWLEAPGQHARTRLVAASHCARECRRRIARHSRVVSNGARPVSARP